MKQSHNSTIFISLAVNVGIAIVNFGAALITGSAAMLAEALQTLVDTTHETFLLLGVHQAKAPPDERFPYGQGKAVYFWGLIAVVCFLAGGLVAIYNGWEHIVHPDPIEFPGVNYVILVIAIILNGVALSASVKQFVRTKGDAGFVDAFRNTKDPSMRLLIVQNTLDIVGASLAFLGIMLSQITGIYLFDGVGSIIVGCMLVGTALWQISRIKSLLIGQSADDYIVQGIRELVAHQGEVRDIEEVTTLHMGPEYVLVNLRLKFADTAYVQDIERVNFSLEHQIRDQFPVAKRVYVMASMPSQSPQNQQAMFGWRQVATLRQDVE
jgi:cation diffusion facilitator family transporter